MPQRAACGRGEVHSQELSHPRTVVRPGISAGIADGADVPSGLRPSMFGP